MLLNKLTNNKEEDDLAGFLGVHIDRSRPNRIIHSGYGTVLDYVSIIDSLHAGNEYGNDSQQRATANEQR